MSAVATQSQHFQEAEGKNWFEFYSIEELPADFNLHRVWGENEGATHAIKIGNYYGNEMPGGESVFRFTRILKTVAYVLVDEDENGGVWEKWNIQWV